MPIQTRKQKEAQQLIDDDIVLFHLFDINETTVTELFPGLGDKNFIDTLSIDISRKIFFFK
jgi:hypothetical protein